MKLYERSYHFLFLFLFSSLFLTDISFAEANTGIIIKYKDSVPSLRSNFSTNPSHFINSKTEVIQLSDSESTQDTLRNIRQNSQVEYAEEDSIISAHQAPDDGLFSDQWALEGNSTNIHAEKAWDMINDSSSILIALIDSGCNYNHEDIAPNVWHDEAGNPGYNFQNNTTDPMDDFEHGSLVFGIVGAKGNNNTGIAGISWTAKIMCLKVLDSMGNSTISKAVEAIDYAISHKVKIINMSWGYTPTDSPSRSLEDAIQRARTAGILIVASAGNGSVSTGLGQNNDSNPQTANYPSSYSDDNIIAVAATDSSDHLASFSNYGANSVDLGAPGVSILSTHPTRRYDYFTGTSAAAPHVTGAAALVWAFNPTLSYSDVKRLILETTDPQASLAGKTLSGGRLNVASALSASPAGGGHLLESPSALPNPSQSTDANGTTDAGISAHSGCSLSQNTRETNPLYLYLFILTLWVLWKVRKQKAKKPSKSLRY